MQRKFTLESEKSVYVRDKKKKEKKKECVCVRERERDLCFSRNQDACCGSEVFSS